MGHVTAAMNDSERELATIIQRLVRRYRPERIVVFGSAAAGTADADSDIDLLIIKETDDGYFDRLGKVRRLLDTWQPLDIFVLTPRELEKAATENRYFVVEEILKKGRVVYERQPLRRRRQGMGEPRSR
jgi:predicted nucleotidyltransferase